MRPEAYSKIRIALFVALMAATLLSISARAVAADGSAGAGGGSDVPGLFVTLVGLIGSHIDMVFVMIAFCSVVAMALIVKGFLQARRSVMLPRSSLTHMRELIRNRQFKDLEEFTAVDGSFVAKALHPALRRAPSFPAMKDAMETALGEQTAEQFRQIEYLNIIGNLGPLLGLLGTVLGMITAFAALHRAGGNANPAELAQGISAALTHTFLGLLLAIPCLASFGVLRTLVDRLTVQGALEAEELLLMLRPQEAKAAATPKTATTLAEV